MPGSNTVCSPDHVFSGYLEGLFDGKGKEFGRSRANKFLRKICIAKSKVQYGGSLGGDGRERETEKRERKPNVEVVIEGSCDVIGGDFGFD